MARFHAAPIILFLVVAFGYTCNECGGAPGFTRVKIKNVGLSTFLSSMGITAQTPSSMGSEGDPGWEMQFTEGNNVNGTNIVYVFFNGALWHLSAGGDAPGSVATVALPVLQTMATAVPPATPAQPQRFSRRYLWKLNRIWDQPTWSYQFQITSIADPTLCILGTRGLPMMALCNSNDRNQRWYILAV